MFLLGLSFRRFLRVFGFNQNSTPIALLIFKGVAAKASTTKTRKKREKNKNAPARRSFGKMNRMESNETVDWASEENLGKWRRAAFFPAGQALLRKLVWHKVGHN